MGLAIIVCIFIVGYLLIATEHLIKLDKAASAILLGSILWVGVVVLKSHIVIPQGIENATEAMLHVFEGHVSEIASILFFLLGAMTIVEIIDTHDGFNVITDRINSKSRLKLLWLISIVTFFLSAILDNLTTAIVMTMLIKKLVNSKEDRWYLGSFVIIAANAGGAWSPIGDVTTIMLWIGGQISSFNIIKSIFLESAVCLMVPLLLASFFMKDTKSIENVKTADIQEHKTITKNESRNVLILGVGALIFIPFFKSMTHLPPFMGILFGLGLLWYYTDIIHRKKHDDVKSKYTISNILKKVDTPSILFFLGILLAVAALQTLGILSSVATYLNESIGNLYAINVVIGLLSAIVDNVPLVAACIAMYPLDNFGIDHSFWTFLAYCAGTGGSVLIIGSAAGVAIMGILKIDFIWYFKKISWIALAGYLSGAALFVLLS